MKSAWLAALLFSFAIAATAQQTPTATKHEAATPPLESHVGKLWEAFKNKDKSALSSLLDDGFRQFEEGLTAFADKKAEVSSVDEFELLSYKLSDFTVKSLGPNAALVTYIAQYEGKSAGETTKARSAFGEVWIRSGNEWKDFYMQETYIK